MRSRVSAGLVLFRQRDGRVEVLLAHPGGPLFRHKDDGYWTVPKGEIEPGEDQLAAALREFKEEVGLEVSGLGPFLPLGSIRQKGGKVVHAWAVEASEGMPPPQPGSNFTMEWPPHSGKFQEFPEVDRVEFFPLRTACQKIKESQVPLLLRLEKCLSETARHQQKTE